MNAYNCNPIEFELQGGLYFNPGPNDGKSVYARYRCFYHVADWKFGADKWERWSELRGGWIQESPGTLIANLFVNYHQSLLDDERDRRLGIKRASVEAA